MPDKKQEEDKKKKEEQSKKKEEPEELEEQINEPEEPSFTSPQEPLRKNKVFLAAASSFILLTFLYLYLLFSDLL